MSFTDFTLQSKNNSAIYSTMRIVFACMLILTLLLAGVSGIRRENHFGNPCKLCECFVEYSDRDVATPNLPYRVAHDPYNSTEDRCLATCLHDDRCKLAVFGFVGGRDVFACELYDAINVRQPIYAPYTNIYVKKREQCKQPAHRFTPLWTKDADESILARKSRYLKLALQQNPFNFG